MCDSKQYLDGLLDTYRLHGRKRIPLPAFVSFAMRKLGTSLEEHLDHFHVIHNYIRTHWGNGNLFSSRRGVQGGIKIRDHVRFD